MKKLARNWRKSNGENLSLPTRDDDDSRPMDTEEQEDLVRSLEQTQAHRSLLWRRVFAGLLLCYIAFQLYSIYQQRYNAYFMGDIESWMVISAGNGFGTLAILGLCWQFSGYIICSGCQDSGGMSSGYHLGLLVQLAFVSMLTIYLLSHQK